MSACLSGFGCRDVSNMAARTVTALGVESKKKKMESSSRVSPRAVHVGNVHTKGWTFVRKNRQRGRISRFALK